VVGAWAIGFSIISFSENFVHLAMVISMIVSFLIILATKTLSLSELQEALKTRRR